MKAKYDGTCQVCGIDFEAGTEITAIAPKGRRRRWLLRHVTCHRRGGGKVLVRHECPDCGGPHPRGRCRDGQALTWPARKHTRSWTTVEEFSIVEQAMTKMART